MAYTEHTPVKPERIAATAAVSLEESLVLPAAFTRKGIEEFRGAKDDTINVKVEGVLPYRTYGWRNNRSTSLVFDTYSERSYPMTFGDDIYSGVKLSDEQATMDFDGWTKLASKQTEAIGRGLERKAAAKLEAAPYEVEVQLDEANLRGSLARLKQVFDRLMVPGQRRIFVSDDLEIALLDDDKLNLASNVGEAEAVSALREATLGRKYGFEFVKAQELTAGVNVAAVDGGFIFLTAAPAVPQSAWGAVGSHEGVALRWTKGFDVTQNVEMSVFFAYQDFDYVVDPLIGVDGSDQAFVSTTEHFVRAVKVTVGTGYSVEVDNDELADITGIQSTDGLNDGA